MTRTAVIAGVGPGLGESLARKFAAEGCRVALFARSADYLEDLAADLPDPGEGLAVPTDLTAVEQIRDGFETVREAFGPVDVLVNHASAASWTGLMDTSVEEFEEAWAVNGRGAFACSQEAVGDMLETGGGTVVFTGATSSVRSLGGAIGFTAAKFAARGMAMDIAQEFGPEGVHVAHVVIDGQIDSPGVRERSPDRDGDTFLDPDEMAETYWHLVERDDVGTQPFEVHVTNGPRNSEFI
ncbi:NADP-dependent 3-hydroxy acid dehydrogenase YdfG [Halorubrum ezzemoulense]|uniref:NADP-dependent 3-hydroxy acid dehydrogenase YdfG n=1 Tax=Halorubrum ezzemoulense TaxID=337243 RepID=A0A238WFB2_HALEZ|nr:MULTISPECIES: SDR family NAD(P)-dependent oxidoreductase [Halorubrum]MDB9279891.1 SDR family NAD(P)-dependent oxidoreductase [Halorubrum ezzemoulense]MDB9283154.1 SDR family NAD(P)-dependent oxidoreductase [Halorubrum ezzemoulense]TKX40634.1 SDR family NAD(P)-dependent oxidoreductase [Halorubrum sp. CGM4_25_10-8A]TKX67276.1 SDR family NAD(P)-dependent oxidoreductase [Halorubrum sp. GN12_10-3_MGM]SNR45118.1 NADP-dependent 3-hydroxy acid dehydrogenase YdfG [Halorubrum ezzemoulense]